MGESQVTVIGSKKGTLIFKDIWAYRDLLVLLVRRDVVSFYKQTIFGPIWFFIQPVFTTVIFIFLFNQVAGISTDGLPPVLFYMTGITVWNYFADCLVKTSTVFKDNAHVFGKVYFPRIIMPLSIVVGNLVKFVIQMCLLIVVYGYYLLNGKFVPELGWQLILLPLIILLMALLGLALGMLISALTTKYRDLSFLVGFGVQLLMYATAVAYPLSAAPEKYKSVIAANPLTILIESFRFGLLGKGVFDTRVFFLQGLIIVIILIFSIRVFNKVEKNFMDTV